MRTPNEFALDHIPGAVNFPVLSNDERVQVGAMYKQVSEFAAKKLGAALIARNIADHLQSHFFDRPRNWHPLVYCWRGGQRSGAMQHILRQVGWCAEKLAGGYKTYRRSVNDDLAVLPMHYRFQVICGLTGSGKSEVLSALAELGAQVLDLERLASHRGSVLGDLPAAPQPSQKMFDSLIWRQLQHYDPSRPVFVEAESQKIGVLRVPPALIAAMWQPGECIHLFTNDTLRITLLKQQYAHFLAEPNELLVKLDHLTPLYGHHHIYAWKQLALDGAWDQLVGELLHQHYDRHYMQSMQRHYPDYAQQPSVVLGGLDAASFSAAAQHMLALAGRVVVTT